MADMDLVREVAAADSYLAVLAATRPDGSIHASLVKAGILDDPETGQVSIGVVVAGSARKLDYLRRSGRASLVFKDGWRWVAVEGPLRLEGPDDPAPGTSPRSISSLIRSVYAAAGGTHDDWEEFDRAMVEDRRCVVLVRAETITGNPT
ncbi:MAG TPA: pyridoxamine 5'-phosphate oxidase family protein [Acidimicrobiales bacterium]|jgi:PPOX class probable F420-dependent enzyme